jgi:tRNA modification GTPase
VIEVHLDLDGYPVTLLDTAGIRESADAIEQEGVRRAVERAADADLVLWVDDSGASHSQAVTVFPASSDRWTVWNKSDKQSEKDKNNNQTSMYYIHTFRLSSLSGEGVDSLLYAMSAWAKNSFQGEPTLVTRERQRRMLEDVSAALDRARAEGPTGREDIVAEELRAAATSLGRLTGHVDVEDVLDRLFRDFCIGK